MFETETGNALALDPAHLTRLMAEAPSVAERVQRAVRARSSP